MRVRGRRGEAEEPGVGGQADVQREGRRAIGLPAAGVHQLVQDGGGRARLLVDDVLGPRRVPRRMMVDAQRAPGRGAQHGLHAAQPVRRGVVDEHEPARGGEQRIVHRRVVGLEPLLGGRKEVEPLRQRILVHDPDRLAASAQEPRQPQLGADGVSVRVDVRDEHEARRAVDRAAESLELARTDHGRPRAAPGPPCGPPPSWPAA